MKLRHHPKLRVTLGALSPWPPLWYGPALLETASLPADESEQGFLKTVEVVSPRTLILTAEHCGVERQGVLKSHDPKFLARLHEVLTTRGLGRPLPEVGDLEVAF